MPRCPKCHYPMASRCYCINRLCEDFHAGDELYTVDESDIPYNISYDDFSVIFADRVGIDRKLFYKRDIIVHRDIVAMLCPGDFDEIERKVFGLHMSHRMDVELGIDYTIFSPMKEGANRMIKMALKYLKAHYTLDEDCKRIFAIFSADRESLMVVTNGLAFRIWMHMVEYSIERETKIRRNLGSEVSTNDKFDVPPNYTPEHLNAYLGIKLN